MTEQMHDAALGAGLRAGLGLALVTFILSGLAGVGFLPAIVGDVTILFLLVSLCFVGRAAGRASGFARVGAVAGAVASLPPALVILLANVVLMGMSGGLAALLIGRALPGLVIWLGLGFCLGALGGVVGRGFRLPARQPLAPGGGQRA